MDAVNIDTSLVKVIDGKFCASFFCSTDQAQQPDRVVLHRRDGQCRRAVDAHGARHQGRAGDHLAERSGRHGAVGRRVRGDGREVHLGSRPAVRAHGRLAADERRHRRVHGDLQRLRVRADSPEDRHGRSRHPGARAAAGRSPRARRAARIHTKDGVEDVAGGHAATASRIPPASATRFAAAS